MKRLFLSACLGLVAVVLVVILLQGSLLGAEATTVLFTDDFESGMDKWTPQNDTNVSIVTDGGTQVYSVTNGPASVARSLVTGTAEALTWADYAVQARVQVVTGTNFAMLMARVQDKGNYYFMTVRMNGRVELRRYRGGATTLKTVNDVVSPTTWYTVTLEVDGNNLRGYINGALVATAVDTSTQALYTGTIGVGTDRATGWFDDVNVALIPATLRVAKSGTGSGTVSSTPAGISCGITCTADFDKGTVVTLTAVPAPASTFEGWGGACLGPGTVIIPGTASLPPQCVVPMTAAMDVTATFGTYNIFMPVVSRN